MPEYRRSQYRIIPPDQVQPGDVYKFTPLTGPPVYADVLAVLPDQNLLQTRARHGGSITWTYIRPPAGQVTFARMQDDGKCQ